MKAVFFILLAANLMLLAWILFGHDEPGTAPQSDPVPGVDSIVLLSEQGEAAAEAAVAPAPEQPGPTAETLPDEVAEPVAETAAEPAAPAVAQNAADICYTVGPFRDLDKLRGIIKAIRDEVVEASFRSREESEQTLFWVYLAPHASLADARAKTRALRSNGIDDSFIITDGDKARGISLGYFREKPRAYKLRDTVAGKGFQPRIDPIFRNYTIYWLDYQVSRDADAVDPLAGQDLGESVSRFDRACE